MPIRNKVAVGQREEASASDAIKAALAEFIGTFLFVFVGLGTASAFTKLVPGGELTPAAVTMIAAAHGLAIVFTVAATANISGGHINPAVTLGLVVGGNLTVVRGVLYWIGQLLGAILAAVILKWVVATDEGIAVTALGGGVSRTAGLVTEIILTFGLVFVVYATAVDSKKGGVGVIAPIAIGFTVFASIFVGAPYSGASLNPARSFGPAVANWDFHHNWIYWVGPLVGGAIGGLVYDSIFLDEEPEHEPVPHHEGY